MLREIFASLHPNFELCIIEIWDTNSTGLQNLADVVNFQMEALERLGTKGQIVEGVLPRMVLNKAASTTITIWDEHQPGFKFFDKRCKVWEATNVAKVPLHHKSSFCTSGMSIFVKCTVIAHSLSSACSFSNIGPDILDKEHTVWEVIAADKFPSHHVLSVSVFKTSKTAERTCITHYYALS